MQVQAFFVIFLINAFQSLENELVRHECLRLVSMSTWVRPRGMSGSGSGRERWLHANSTERPWARGARAAALPAGWTARAGAEQVHQAAQNVEGTAEAERGHVRATLPAGGTRALVPLAPRRDAPLLLIHACVHTRLSHLQGQGQASAVPHVPVAAAAALLLGAGPRPRRGRHPAPRCPVREVTKTLASHRP